MGWLPRWLCVLLPGVMACPQMATKDGFEYQLGVNHLGETRYIGACSLG
jgi:hypothetical protein